MEESPIINIVGTRCRPEDEARFNKWYNEVHIPMLMKFKGMKGAGRYRIVSEGAGYPTYLAIYQFEDKKAYEDYQKSPELAAIREEMKISWPNGIDISWRAPYELIKSWRQTI